MGWLPTTIKRWDFCPAFYGGKEMKIMQIITLILIALNAKNRSKGHAEGRAKL